MTDALCVLHLRAASGTCSRCGSFVCDVCAQKSGDCERCTEVLSPLSL